MFTKKLYISLSLLALYILIFFLKNRFTGELYQDEFHYLPTAALFAKEFLPSIDLLQSYNELNTPIPFILGGWAIRLFGEDIQNLRLLTLLTSFVLLMIFVWNSPAISGRFWLSLLGLMVFPNFYLCSVYFYTDIFAMVFVLAGIAFYLKHHHWAGMISLIAAISCRQYMLAFPAAIVGFEIFNMFRRSVSFQEFLKDLLLQKRVWIYYVVAVLSIVPWVILWKGPAPAPVMAEQYYDSDKLVKYNFGYLIYACVVVAVYHILPEMLVLRKLKFFRDYVQKHFPIFVAFLIVIAALILLFPAKQAHNPYFTWPYLGYVDQLLETVGISGIIKQILFGMLALITFMRFISPRMSLASWVLLTNVLLLGKAQLSWDKYALPLIMVLWFLAMFDQGWWETESKSQIPASAKS